MVQHALCAERAHDRPRPLEGLPVRLRRRLEIVHATRLDDGGVARVNLTALEPQLVHIPRAACGLCAPCGRGHPCVRACACVVSWRKFLTLAQVSRTCVSAQAHACVRASGIRASACARVCVCACVCVVTYLALSSAGSVMNASTVSDRWSCVVVVFSSSTASRIRFLSWAAQVVVVVEEE
jgi:hypothetical protein